MKNKSLIILIVVFALLIAGAAVLYNSLSADMAPDKLQVQATPTPTPESISEPEADAEAEPEQVTAPDFTVYDKDGNTVNLSDFRGKPTIINFWASWCYYCVLEMPEFQAKFEELGDEVNFLMINTTDGNQETEESANKFLEENGYTFPVYYDKDMMASYVYGAYSLPMTYGIDADGYAVVKANGAISADDLDQIIEMLK